MAFVPTVDPPVVLFVEPLSYHWYDKVTPPDADTLKASVPPTHSVIAVGCVLIVGTALIVVAVALLVALVQPLPVELTTT